MGDANASEDRESLSHTLICKCDSKMEGDDSLKTVECLRGRLLAERQASRVARDNAEIMAEKLTQLENQLREETKLWIKAEKKLHFLMKKLDSLNMHPNSSEICGLSCTSSTSSNDPQITNSTVSQEIKDNLAETTNFFRETATSKDSCCSEDPKRENPRLQLAMAEIENSERSEGGNDDSMSMCH